MTKDYLKIVTEGTKEAALAALQELSDLYGPGDSPLLDSEFDELQLLYNNRFSENYRPSYRVRSNEVAHDQDFPGLANFLDKAQEAAGLKDWLLKRFKEIEKKVKGVVITLLSSPKYDGLSLTITYDGTNGKIKRALTRGEDGKGADYTAFFAGDTHWQESPSETDFGVKYEAVMSWKALEQLNATRAIGEKYKNPRNTVAGILSGQKAELRKYVTLVPLDIEVTGADYPRIERLMFLSDSFDSGLYTPNPVDHLTPFEWYDTVDILDTMMAYEEIYKLRTDKEWPYMIDGAVTEFIDPNVIEALGGAQADTSKHSVATKFPYMTASTKAISMDFDKGRTGRITPVVNFEDVVLNGNTYNRTSIANFTRFDELKLAPGTPLHFELRGDIIGWLDRAGPDPVGAVPFAEPEGLLFTYNEVGQRVYGMTDADLTGRVERMMVKCGVKGVMAETLKKLEDAGVIKEFHDIWTIDKKYTTIREIQGLGELSAMNICAAIEEKNEAGHYDWEIISSLGIPNIGNSLAKTAMMELTIPELMAIVKTDHNEAIAKLAVLGEERPVMFVKGLLLHLSELEDLLSVIPKVICTKANAPTYSGQKYKVVVTGDLKYFEDRDVFQRLIESMGHKMVSSISKKTDYLITNTPNSGTTKNVKAKEQGVSIITEEEAITILGLSAHIIQAEEEASSVVADSLSDIDNLLV